MIKKGISTFITSIRASLGVGLGVHPSVGAATPIAREVDT